MTDTEDITPRRLIIRKPCNVEEISFYAQGMSDALEEPIFIWKSSDGLYHCGNKTPKTEHFIIETVFPIREV